MLQRLNRFLMDRITQDYRSIPPHLSGLDQVCMYANQIYIILNHDRYLPRQPQALFDAQTVKVNTQNRSQHL
jgi:hypothetical protein